ncbi:MAG: bile acid:sodium symporter [Myxococcota bacterium]
MLSGLDKALIGALTVILMVGMGASLTLDDYRRALARPRAVVIGLVAQFGWMPLASAVAISALGLEGTAAAGLLLMACASGGNASNMFAYFSRADLALSISMTAVSTLLSVVLTPLLLFAYAPSLGQTATEVPYLAVMVTLAAMLVPIALGMWVRHRSPERAKRVERIGSVAGAILLAVLLVTSVTDQIDLVRTASNPSLLACFLVAGSGMLLGYSLARVTRLAPPQRHAVSLETGIQNAPLAIAVILATFPEEQQDALLQLPLLYAMTALFVGAGVTLLYRRFPEL